MTSFAKKIETQEAAAHKAGIASKSGDWFKFQEGDNAFRVLEEPELIFEKFKVGICYTGCGYEGTPRFMTYILDRKDNKIKLAKLPYKIGTTIASYENDEDYAFTGFPMDYDIKVFAKNAGTKEVEYTVTPRPKREDIDSETAEELMKMKRIPDIIAKMKEKQKEKMAAEASYQGVSTQPEEIETVQYGEEDDYPTTPNPEDIAF